MSVSTECVFPGSAIILAAGKDEQLGWCFEEGRVVRAIRECIRAEEEKSPEGSRRRRGIADRLERMGGMISQMIPPEFKDIVDRVLQGTVAQLLPQDLRATLTVDMMIEFMTNMELWRATIDQFLGDGADGGAPAEVRRRLRLRGPLRLLQHAPLNLTCLDQCVFEKAELLGADQIPDEQKVLDVLREHAADHSEKSEKWLEELESNYRSCISAQAQVKRAERCFRKECLASNMAAQCMLDALARLCAAIR